MSCPTSTIFSSGVVVGVSLQSTFLFSIERLREMNECIGCVFYYYEKDTNWAECRHPNADVNKPDDCPGRYSIEDAQAVARYRREK